MGFTSCKPRPIFSSSESINGSNCLDKMLLLCFCFLVVAAILSSMKKPTLLLEIEPKRLSGFSLLGKAVFA